MNLDERPYIYLWRPFYRNIVVPVIWPFLGRLRDFFLREDLQQLQSQQAALALKLEQQAELLRQLAQQLATMEREVTQQWLGIEELLLNLFGQPDDRGSGSKDTAEPTRVHRGGPSL